MKFKNILLSIPLIAITVGCSTISYVEPQTGDLSRVRFAIKETGLVIVRAYENLECAGENEWMRLSNAKMVNSSPKSLGIPLQDYSKNAFKEFYIPSKTEKVVIFSGDLVDGHKILSCGVPISLEFLEKNKDYELLFNQDVFGCSVTASEIQKTTTGEAIKTELNTYSNRQKGFGDGCMKAFKKKFRW